MKKIISSLAALALASAFASADDIKLSFYNKLYEEDAILIHSDEADETTKDFPGIKERMQAEVTSEKVDALVKATVTLDDYDEKHFGLQGEVNDWYVEFRPIDKIALGMHTGIFADGSTLPIYDDNVNAANIGSDGFTVSVFPIENLRFAVTAPFSFDGSPEGVNWIDGNKNEIVGEDEDGNPIREDENFNIGFGAIYDHELFQIGASVQDVADSDQRQIGAYINLPKLFGKVEPLTIGAGFAHSEAVRAVVGDADLISVGPIESCVSYKDLLSAYATFETEKVTVAAEMAYNLGCDDETFYDFYSAASVSFGIVENLTATATGKILVDLKDKDETQKNITMGAFALDYDLNENNTVGAEFDIAMRDKDWAIAVPVYWKYHF
ncbi:MAG: hypothetical protein SPL22_07025 [Treponema sp.]|uniref:hypothetical protein n=1 Tax=Treponema sp. TaxID=166 RepID=UPI002A91A85D|nr:hypothetical protein [Treponema sp.]MDY6397470.1 hypothetical protein [Treponema sp.]